MTFQEMLLAAIETFDPVVAFAVALQSRHRVADLRRQTQRAGDVLAQRLLPRFAADENQPLRRLVLERGLVILAAQFQLFDQAYVMTGGRFFPDNATNTLVGYLYQKAFVELNMGAASAAAWVLFLIVFAVTVIQLVGQRRWVYYD